MANKNSNKQLIPAAGYLRKSTDNERIDPKTGEKRRSQEKSIPQQKREISRLAESQGFEIVRWYADPGKSGWKRGAARPDFNRMLSDTEVNRDIQAIVVDNIDRFSRASVDEVQADALRLKTAGVRHIVTAAQGTFDLGRSGHDIGEIMKFGVAVWSAHEYVRQHGRRVCLARRNRALEGKRSGGPAPYGMKNDGNGGLNHGDPKEVAVVRRIFDEFVNEKRSVNKITAGLNADNIPGPRGGKWFVPKVRDILARRAYRGDFEFGMKKSGRFFNIDGKHEVVEAGERQVTETDSTMITEGKYEPIIPPTQFDAAQSQIAKFARGKRRPRESTAALTGVLRCDHCGGKMYSFRPTGRNYTAYRCDSNFRTGAGTCAYYQIREERILPLVLKLLAEEIDDIGKLMSEPPERLFPTNGSETAELKSNKAKLEERIKRGVRNLLDIDDAQTRQEVEAVIVELRNEVAEIDSQLVDAGQDNHARAVESMKALAEWHNEFLREAVTIPVDLKSKSGFAGVNVPGFNWATFLAAWSGGTDPALPQGIKCDARVVNEALIGLGTEVRLRWKSRESGRQRHFVDRGRFRLGQFSEEITAKHNGTFCTVPLP